MSSTTEQIERTPAALYARVSSDRQDVDLSVSAQLRALRDYADKNDYQIVREFVDEAESGRVMNRPDFQKMIDEAKQANTPFKAILVWKFSRFTRKREHAVVLKSQLRRRGLRVVSITEQAEDNPTGRLMEGIIETIDEYYSENLATEVLRGMREAASRGFWVAPMAPYGYRKVKVPDGPKERPTLEIDPDTSPIVKRMFDLAESRKGMLKIARILNDEGIASPRGKLWNKMSIHNILNNEAYLGTLVWGNNASDGADPVRVDNAFPATVTKTQFDRVNRIMRSRAPRNTHPRRVGSTFLLSGLVKCYRCRRALSGRYSSRGTFPYYVCHSFVKRAPGSCDSPRVDARQFEGLVVGLIRSNILTEGNIRSLV
ncbi:MAG: recombinase family protein, partial [Chloroflexota bacterium]|nr:recombinase family protein [Chloroflexota bacterium]